MESALVDAVVGKIVEMMVEEINKEVSLVLNFKKDFEWLSKKLTTIKGYLTYADVQSAHNASVKRWLLDVAEIALDAEDILDECALKSQGTENEIPQSSCVCAFSCSQLVFRCKMARRIKEVKDRMRSVMEEGAELKLVGDVTHSDQPSTSTSGNVKWRGTSQMEIDSRPVAIEPKVEDVLRLLEDPSTPVIAVVGMGGQGKTFLMQNIFQRIKDKFEKSIWLSISQTYSLRKLQADMASQIKLQAGEDLEIKSKADMVIYGQVSELQAAECIHDCLTSRSSLIVLDDVWRATGEDNLIAALGLPAGHNTQCKIVVTTRSKFVCSNMNACVYELQPLSEEESWNLFCAFAFHGNQPPRHLQGVARQVEGECGRLPLAVKTVAASLADKTLSRDWESKLEQLKAASYTQDPIMQILKLSYDSLPPHLKPCFVYLSFFPEDEEIDYQYLINLWVAEGYVPQGDDQLDIGWSYVCHLHSLCLVERVYEYQKHRYDQYYRWFK
ncbi:disease resistance RPP13-like protein 4 [Cryptomeria japonica]|uniref:disease resistance RPP13-like protein 4 n=1 Tax=Cryptomeria japonica TaxID=3369 RepID=UPI0027DAB32F|nr:disease resistance RPP13-like protein 4 [Cryptomeria japonica]